MSPARSTAFALLLAGGTSCGKVAIHDVGARFQLADTSWFAEEETLFVFYKVSADQGIGENSVIEITYATDDERVDWTPLDQITPVHGHVPVDCGLDHLCGSTSIHVAGEPREVALRMRYHRDGELALNADTVFNAVGTGSLTSPTSACSGAAGTSSRRCATRLPRSSAFAAGFRWRTRPMAPTS